MQSLSHSKWISADSVYTTINLLNTLSKRKIFNNINKSYSSRDLMSVIVLYIADKVSGKVINCFNKLYADVFV